MVLIRLALTPAETNAFFTEEARWSPKARLYSVEPRESPVSLNREVEVGMLVEELSVGLNGGLLVGANVALIVLEIDIFDALAEEIFFRG